MKLKAYASAGVDIDLGNRVKAGLPELLAATRRPGVLGKVGGFGGLFALDVRKYQEPVLVSSVDGVGTKLKLAFAMDRHDTIGQDLVNHCVNDIAVQGATHGPAPILRLGCLRCLAAAAVESSRDLSYEPDSVHRRVLPTCSSQSGPRSPLSLCWRSRY